LQLQSSAAPESAASKHKPRNRSLQVLIPLGNTVHVHYYMKSSALHTSPDFSRMTLFIPCESSSFCCICQNGLATDGRSGCVHGIENLYVTGSSLFPTPGFANPTLTIVALAVRLAEHLRDGLFSSEFYGANFGMNDAISNDPQPILTVTDPHMPVANKRPSPL
jgi:hypothetical protein